MFWKRPELLGYACFPSVSAGDASGRIHHSYHLLGLTSEVFKEYSPVRIKGNNSRLG